MGRKRDIRQIEAVAREFRMTDIQRREFGDYVEECKQQGDHGSGPNGDFTFQELREKAQEFLGDD